MYYLHYMADFKNMIKPFGFIKKDVDKGQKNVPKYVKPDGTKVYEEQTPLGRTVYEVSPDCTVICMTYDKSDKLILDWIRRRNLEIGRTYDEYGKIVYEFNSLYEKDNTLAKKTEISYEYYDEGQKSKEIIIIMPSEIKTEINYDKEGKVTEKIEIRGSVKTYFNAEGKPFKREIDRGSGGIITENL